MQPANLLPARTLSVLLSGAAPGGLSQNNAGCGPQAGADVVVRAVESEATSAAAPSPSFFAAQVLPDFGLCPAHIFSVANIYFSSLLAQKTSARRSTSFRELEVRQDLLDERDSRSVEEWRRPEIFRLLFVDRAGLKKLLYVLIFPIAMTHRFFFFLLSVLISSLESLARVSLA